MSKKLKDEVGIEFAPDLPIPVGLDARIVFKERLEPPEPLPHVSRRALKRVKDRLTIPTTCPCCGRDGIELVENWEIYNGRTYGDWPYVYLHRACRAYMGLHPDTDLPLGTLADKETREARKKGKSYFNRLMKLSGKTRDELYEWLAKSLRIPQSQCHWSWFDAEWADRAGRCCAAKLKMLTRRNE